MKEPTSLAKLLTTSTSLLATQLVDKLGLTASARSLHSITLAPKLADREAALRASREKVKGNSCLPDFKV